MSATKAILLGHLFVNGPAILVMICFVWIGTVNWGSGPVGGYILLSVLPIWFWYKYSTRQWRQWALAQGIDKDRLQRLSIKTLLMRRSDWIS